MRHYELPKVVFNNTASYLDHRLEKLRGVRDPNDRVDLKVYEAEMERRRRQGLQLKAETARFRAKLWELGYDRSMLRNQSGSGPAAPLSNGFHRH